MATTQPTAAEIRAADWRKVQGWAKHYIPALCRPPGKHFYTKPKLVELLFQHFGYPSDQLRKYNGRKMPDQLTDLACFGTGCFNEDGYGRDLQLGLVQKWGDHRNRMTCYKSWEVSL